MSFARTRGIEVVFVYIPIKYRVYRNVIEAPRGSPLRAWNAWTELPERFRSFCASVSSPCLDLTAPFQRAVHEGAMVYARTDTHWRPEGHALAAAELERVLRDRGWAEAGPRP